MKYRFCSLLRVDPINTTINTLNIVFFCTIGNVTVVGTSVYIKWSYKVLNGTTEYFPLSVNNKIAL